MNTVDVDQQLAILSELDSKDGELLPTRRICKNMYAKAIPSIDSLRRQKKYLEIAITHLENKLFVLEDICDFCWEVELKYRTVKKLKQEFTTLLERKSKDFDRKSEKLKKKNANKGFKYRKKDFEDHQQF